MATIRFGGATRSRWGATKTPEGTAFAKSESRNGRAVDPRLLCDQLVRQKRGISTGYGFSAETLDTPGLHIVTGPRVAEDGFRLAGRHVRRGVVVSVTEPYLEWARGRVIERDYDVFYHLFPTEFISEGAKRGEELVARPLINAFVLGCRPPGAGATARV